MKNCATKEKPLKPIEDTLYPKVIERAKKTKSKIDVYTLHRAKVVQRKRDILKAKSDIDNEEIIDDYGWGKFTSNPSECNHGEYGKRREQKIQYKKIIWQGVLAFILIVVAYMIWCLFN
jgi:hypothetical protein